MLLTELCVSHTCYDTFINKVRYHVYSLFVDFIVSERKQTSKKEVKIIILRF